MSLTPEILEETKSYWKHAPSRSMYHHAISLVISQRIKFTSGKIIRERLFSIIPKCSEYTREAIAALSNEQLKSIGIPSPKITCMRSIGALGDRISIDSLATIRGIGPWTIKSLQLLFNTNPDVSLVEDYWIRQRLSELKGLNRVCSASEASELFEEWTGYRTSISHFLWRIRPEGIAKVRKEEQLDKDDFL